MSSVRVSMETVQSYTMLVGTTLCHWFTEIAHIAYLMKAGARMWISNLGRGRTRRTTRWRGPNSSARFSVAAILDNSHRV
jgi:hypothetical protein